MAKKPLTGMQKQLIEPTQLVHYCKCGHTGGNSKNPDHAPAPGTHTKGHGRCRRCPCKRFTWTRSVQVPPRRLASVLLASLIVAAGMTALADPTIGPYIRSTEYHSGPATPLYTTHMHFAVTVYSDGTIDVSAPTQMTPASAKRIAQRVTDDEAYNSAAWDLKVERIRRARIAEERARIKEQAELIEQQRQADLSTR